MVTDNFGSLVNFPNFVVEQEERCSRIEAYPGRSMLCVRGTCCFVATYTYCAVR